MPDDTQDDAPRDLPPAALRALAEAAERRALAEAEARANPRPPELGGRNGLEPVRYGDWEKKGLAVDF
ncbi:DUF1674 domain-containing protein [Puniceibacterium sp. IMCC21224]|uniref:DUF1674 domain-containing protein n=1 Tax=Puniceibacterium sp. IMCC21224 TaxID=1618204 RepID=UPI00064DB87F|nr:DUF1674 domain-containing protein [Puniceibacterium sp. IMCC21224]KMK68678.1 uncharacterized conserved small protein [Puniceibacterium sp. IMCC21224]